ncbi:hypothetical protein DL767_010596 [Monosporascus sp. MG133]|nr:hypothetical protein DL767_010596 [Monosporascus sp. MG133]
MATWRIPLDLFRPNITQYLDKETRLHLCLACKTLCDDLLPPLLRDDALDGQHKATWHAIKRDDSNQLMRIFEIAYEHLGADLDALIAEKPRLFEIWVQYAASAVGDSGLDCLQYLLNRSAGRWTPTRRTAAEAVEAHNLPALNLLLGRGALLGTPDDEHEVEPPPLFRARSAAMIRFLVDNGADPHEVWDGRNALHWHCDEKHTSPAIIEVLAELGLGVDDLDEEPSVLPAKPRTWKSGMPGGVYNQDFWRKRFRTTPLGRAASNANVAAVRTLLRLGADPRKPSPARQAAANATGGPLTRYHFTSPLNMFEENRFGGPNGNCPWKFHLFPEDEERDDMVTEDEENVSPVHSGLHLCRGRSRNWDNGVCNCSYGWYGEDISGDGRDGILDTVSKRKTVYLEQVNRVGRRLVKCAKLLLEAGEPEVDYDIWRDVNEVFQDIMLPIAFCYGATGGVMWDYARGDTWPQMVESLRDFDLAPWGELFELLVEAAPATGLGRDYRNLPGSGQDRLMHYLDCFDLKGVGDCLIRHFRLSPEPLAVARGYTNVSISAARRRHEWEARFRITVLNEAPWKKEEDSA